MLAVSCYFLVECCFDVLSLHKVVIFLLPEAPLYIEVLPSILLPKSLLFGFHLPIELLFSQDLLSDLLFALSALHHCSVVLLCRFLKSLLLVSRPREPSLIA